MSLQDIAQEYRNEGEPDGYDDLSTVRRCSKGHFLPKKVMGYWLNAGMDGQGPITTDVQMDALPEYLKWCIVPYWFCKACNVNVIEE